MYYGDDGLERFPQCPFCKAVIKDGGPMQWGEKRSVSCEGCNSSFSSALQHGSGGPNSYLLAPPYYTIRERQLISLMDAAERVLEIVMDHVEWKGDERHKIREILEKELR